MLILCPPRATGNLTERREEGVGDCASISPSSESSCLGMCSLRQPEGEQARSFPKNFYLSFLMVFNSLPPFVLTMDYLFPSPCFKNVFLCCVAEKQDGKTFSDKRKLFVLDSLHMTSQLHFFEPCIQEYNSWVEV